MDVLPCHRTITQREWDASNTEPSSELGIFKVKVSLSLLTVALSYHNHVQNSLIRLNT